MKYLITGNKGQLGFDIARELIKRGEYDFLSISRDEMDISDSEQVDKVISEYKPDVIFHCAAWTKVDKAEEETEAAYKANVYGTKNITDASIKNDSKLVYISTDYVYDGDKNGIYTEEDKVNPKSVYGKTKYLGECEAKRCPNHVIARTSWVFGINGNNFVKTMLKLAETKSELNVVDDQVGSPTYTVDLAKLLVDIAKSDKTGIYHTTNEGFCSWAEFADYIVKSNNAKMKINKIPSSEYPQKAYRPKNSRLSKDKLEKDGFTRLPDWQNAIERYNQELRLIRKEK